MKKRPLILVTNDDGIHSPGLYAAASAAAKTGEVLIAAPHTQQTGMGRSFPICPDNGIIEKVKVGEYSGYAVHGTPALAVAHGILELADRKPDICISGINYGENLGSCLTCSGTLGAVFEAASYGIPGIAISLEAGLEKQHSLDFEKRDWCAAESILERYIRKVLEEGMPHGADIWNINVPERLEPPYPEKRTIQSRQNYFCFVKPEKRSYGKPYRLTSERTIDLEHLEPDSDIHAVYVERVASATLLKCDMSVQIPEKSEPSS